MKILKILLLGIVLGFGSGMWFGVNMGKGKPLLSNPFAEEDVPQKIKKKVGESIEKLGEDIKGKVKQ